MNQLVVSSRVFIIPFIYCTYCNNWPYALLTLNLLLSSQFYHRRHCWSSFIWDQTAIFLVWFYGVYELSMLPWEASIPYSIISLYMWAIFYGGKVTGRFCFGENCEFWHSTIHFCGATGIILTQHNISSRLENRDGAHH